MKALFVTVTLFGSVSAFSKQSEAKCDANGFCSVERELKSDDGQVYRVPYTFKYRPAKDGEPTVVFIPGGPGATSTERDFSDLAGVPSDFGVILTDPRFVGVNQTGKSENFKSAMSSKEVAEDLLTAVKSAGVKDYILYGQSYGTVVATQAAASAGVNQPRAVVLEGTVGRALKQSEYEKGFYTEWNSFVKDLDPTIFRQFQDRVNSFVRNGQFTAEDIGSVIQALLISRRDSNGRDNLKTYVTFIAKGSFDQVRGVVKALVELVKHGQTADGTDLFYAIVGCKELFPDGNPGSVDFSFDGKSAELKPGGIANCDKYVTSSSVQLYDSRKYQIRAPIFYIQGAYDPATPKWQADRHFMGQTESSGKYFVLVPEGSHAPLNNELSKCSANFWISLARNIESATQSFSSCMSGEKRDDGVGSKATK